MARKSQVGLEMMFGFALMLLLLLVFFGLKATLTTEQQNSKEQVEQENTCWFLSSLISSAWVSGTGFSIRFSLPFEAIINQSFNAQSKSITMDLASCSIQTNQVDNEILQKGNILISNTNNFIEVKNV